VFVIRRSLYDWKAVSFQKHVQSFRSGSHRIILKQFKQVFGAEILVKVILCAASIVDSGKTHSLFVDLTPVNLFFYCTHSQKSVNYNVSLLTYSKNSVNRLVIIGGVPVRI
jgi:hypothetical protein